VDIAEAVGKHGIEIERSEVRLHEGPLRVTGEHVVDLHLHTDVNVEIKVVIEADEASNG
jgi:large subunit ribosomal protein L9